MHDCTESLVILELHLLLQNMKLIWKFRDVVKCWLYEVSESQRKMFVFLYQAELPVDL